MQIIKAVNMAITMHTTDHPFTVCNELPQGVSISSVWKRVAALPRFAIVGGFRNNSGLRDVDCLSVSYLCCFWLF
jgi:hypothetical protein